MSSTNRFSSIMKNPINIIYLIFSVIFINFSGCFLIDDSPLKDANGNDIGSFHFASGPGYGNYYSYADGLIDAASEKLGIFMDNVSTNGSLDNAERLVSGSTYLGNAYMAMMQEDIYEYVRKQCIAQYDTDPDSVNKKYLKIASRTKVLLALYTETVFLLVNNASGISSVDDFTSGHDVNLGTLNSGTYVTASNIIDAWGKTQHTSHYDDAAAGVQKVVDGEYDAAFFVTATPSSLFQNITATTVKLIQVTMPSGKKTYKENSSILAKDYPNLLTDDISGNISVRTLLIGGPHFEDKNLANFLDYIFDNAEEYKAYNQKWGDLSLALSRDYMQANPEKVNFKAMCYFAGYPELDPFYVEDNFFTDYGVSSYHDMYVELDYLLTLNAGVGLKEVNTTGSWENAYRIMMGEGKMAMVQDDIFEYLKNNNDMYDSMMIASMKKLVPLHYEYVHLLINNNTLITDTANWNQWGGTPANLEDIFTDPAALNDEEPHLYINVGPKTSGTFITAMNLINSYRVIDTDSDDTPDMDEMSIYYSFDEPSDAIAKIDSKDIHMSFVVSGVPYFRFYSHDTWQVPAEITDGLLIPAQFYDTANPPRPYKNGILAGGTATTKNYPYDELISSNIATVRVRALQVVSPVFKNDDIDIYLKSVFRKGYYMTVPPDIGNPGTFASDPLWVPIHKESMTASEAVESGYTTTYGEPVEGAMEYFVNNPFGWHDAAADYYLSMFED